MSQALPPEWAKTKQVPTSTINVLGAGGDVVATITVVGTATVTPTWPYTYRLST